MGDVLPLPTARKRRVRSARLDYSAPPPNVVLHPVHAERRSRPAPARKVPAASPELAMILGLLCVLDRRGRADGSGSPMMEVHEAMREVTAHWEGEPAQLCAEKGLNTVGSLWALLADQAATGREALL